MKATKKSLWLSAVSMMLCVVMLLGITFAWFTDSVTNKDNVIQAGNLEVQFDYRGLMETTAEDYKKVDSKALFNDVKWEPGKSFGYDFKVTNAGSLAFDWELSFQNIKSEGGTNNVNIADVLDVYVIENVAVNNLDGVTPAKLSALNNGVVTSGQLKAEDGNNTEEFSVVIKMKEDANNDYQGAKVTFDIYLRAKQATVEKDGFESSDYDKNAEYAPITVEAGSDPTENGAALRRAIDGAFENSVIALKAGTYQLDDALVFTKPVHLIADGEAVLDMSNAKAPIDGGYNTSAALLILSSNVTFEGITVYGNSGQNSIVTVGIDDVSNKWVADGNITVSDELNYDFDWAVNEFAPEYKGVYENVNFYNCTFALKEAGSIGHGLFLESRYTVVKNCTFKNIQAQHAIVKIEEDHTKVLGSIFEGCTGKEYAENWCGANVDGDGNEYPGHAFKCEEGWAGKTGADYEEHLKYAADLGFNHAAEE